MRARLLRSLGGWLPGRTPLGNTFDAPLTMKTKLLFRRTVGDTVVRYDVPTEGRSAPQLSLHPKSLLPVKHREFLPKVLEIAGLPSRWPPFPAWLPDALVQIKCAEDNCGGGGSFAQGRTMRASPSTHALVFVGQKVLTERGVTRVITTLKHPSGLRCEHHLCWEGNRPVFTSFVRVRQTGKKPVTLEMLASFSLGGITPYAPDDAPGRLTLHRFRSAWSAEGRLDSQTVEQLHMEPSWLAHCVTGERFGQVGSMPVRGFFPFAAIEDREVGVLWGARLACAGSWQMEVFRRDDFLALSGGQADREFGHWCKTLRLGGTYETPPATLACVRGNLDELCQRLNSAQEAALTDLPEIENELPIIVNEWCTSWGNPTDDSLRVLADRLRGTPAKYLVIDDGWAERPAGAMLQANGDWIVNKRSFPSGLAATCRAIRQAGLVPGLWFEFEVCNPGSKAFGLTDHHLHRDGRVLQVGTRRFWDFRDPWTHDYLTQKVIRLLKDNGFGYLKVDYNDNLGIGVDGAESPGEGLRQHLEGVQAFFRELRRQLPDLVIENCSSGGHRLEPGMMGLCSMGSFSDAHETVEVPIIAAAVQRLILPRQSQIWAVLRKSDSTQRQAYSLAATFLGRMCLSGELNDLSAAQWRNVVAAMDLYRRVHPVIRDGHSVFHGELGASWRHPRGWQGVLRTGKGGDRALLVAHTFGGPLPRRVLLPLPPGKPWTMAEAWPSSGGLTAKVVQGNRVEIRLGAEFRATVLDLHRR